MYSDEERVRDWLQDVIDDSQRIAQYIGSRDFDEFLTDRLVRDAVERCLERIIEAGVRVGPERIARIAPGLPLHKMRGLGNILRHAYEGIDAKLIWDTVTQDIPALSDACARALTQD